MPALPALILGLASAVFVAWRPGGRRGGWIAESLFAAAALAAAWFARRSIPALLQMPLWPSEPVEVPVAFALNPWNWCLLVSLHTLILGDSLVHGRSLSDGPRASSASWMGFCAVISLATVAVSAMAVILTWTLAIAAQSWLHRAASTGGWQASTWGPLRARDIATMVFVVAAFGLGRQGGERGDIGVYACLLAACGLRLSSVMWPPGGEVASGVSTVARMGWSTGLSVLAALAWGLGTDGVVALGGWLVAAGAVSLLAAIPLHLLTDEPQGRSRAWLLGLTGIALLTAAVSPPNQAAGLAASGAMLVGGGALGLALPLGGVPSRLGSGIAAATMIGMPLTAGGLWLGVLASGGEGVTALGWAALLGAGVLSARFLADLLRSPRALVFVDGVTVAAGAIISLTGIGLYLGLRALVPAPVLFAPLIALVVAAVISVALAGIPPAGRDRVVRALRWPAILGWELVAPFVTRIESWLRAVRDLLEGDASLLWAMAVAVAVVILMQGAR